MKNSDYSSTLQFVFALKLKLSHMKILVGFYFGRAKRPLKNHLPLKISKS